MKIAAFFVATLSAVSAFTSQSAGRANTQLSESLADKVRTGTSSAFVELIRSFVAHALSCLFCRSLEWICFRLLRNRTTMVLVKRRT